MRARLMCPFGEARGTFEFEGEATLGRHPDNTITLLPELLSSRHARIYYDSHLGRYVLEDLDSLNGTSLDGEVVKGKEPLGHLHVVTLAENFDFVFQDLDRCAFRHGASEPPSHLEASSERTLLEPMPMPLPGFLSDRPASGPISVPRPPDTIELPGDAAPPPAQAKPPGRVPDTIKIPSGSSQDSGPVPEREKTLLEKLPLPLPNFLKREQEPPIDDELLAELTRESLEDSSSHGGQGPWAEAAAAKEAEESSSGDAGSAGLGSKAGDGSSAGDGRSANSFYLELTYPDGRNERLRLRAGENLIGRSSKAQLRPDSPELSRRHALLTLAGETLTLEDLGSRNHTYLEGVKVEGTVDVPADSRLRFGALEARIVKT